MSKLFSIPNLLSISRIVLTPVIVCTFLFPVGGINFISPILFLTASISDFFDGYIARKYNSETKIGALLDLIGDKTLVVIILLCLIFKLDSYSIFLATCMIIFRELVILTIRSLEGQQKVSVIVSAKFKTTLQMIAIFLLLFSPNEIFYNSLVMGEFILWLSVIMSYFSLFQYISVLNK